MEKLSNLKSRPATQIMKLKCLGARYPSRLSFTRSLVNTMRDENWKIKRKHFKLDSKGYGSAVYEVKRPQGLISFVCFSAYLPEEQRTDRVIANSWDTSYVLVLGKVTKKHLARLQRNVPLQEVGRFTNSEIVLSRANKSLRLFQKVVDSLANGKQPSLIDINSVGYLLRTTAVYGSGKFGLMDFHNLRLIEGLDQPYRAEMLLVYLVREFSFDLVEHMATSLNKKKAVQLSPEIKRYLGIGNATGLGMAPYLIHHPQLIHKWISCYERALIEISKIKNPSIKKKNQFIELLRDAKIYIENCKTEDRLQNKKNILISKELDLLIDAFTSGNIFSNTNPWLSVINMCKTNYSLDTCEIANVQLIEIYPKISDRIANDMACTEEFHLKPESSLKDLKRIIEREYSWALKINFKNKNANYFFWYVSEEKLEPRLGVRKIEKGSDLESPLDIGRMVSNLYKEICNMKVNLSKAYVADLLLKHPNFRGIIKRIQSLSELSYSEIRDNVLGKNLLPIDMLRFKLSFYGASQYNPKSDRWLRVNFFSGAPLSSELNNNKKNFPGLPIFQNSEVN